MNSLQFRSDRWKRKLIPWIFLAPSLFATSLFLLFPFLDALRRAFVTAMGGQFVGFKNFQNVLKNPAFQLASKNTFLFTIICIPLLLALSLGLALLLNASGIKRGFMKISFLMPVSVPAASIVLIWKITFHDRGLLNGMMEGLGFSPVSWLNSSWTFWLLIGSYLWKNIGYDMVLWLAGLSAISPELYEAADVDGAGPFQKLFYITLPGLKPICFTVSVLSLLNSFKVFREAYLLVGDYPDSESVYLLQHLFNNWFLTLDIDRMCAASTLLALCMLAAIQLLRRLFREKEESA